MNRNVVLDAVESWYGYGTWSAPWFIGPEPGMAKYEGDDLKKRCVAWRRLGSLELIDCATHHKTFHRTHWHDRTIRMRVPIDDEAMRPPTQTTWRRLIQLLLAFKGEGTDLDAVADYQCRSWDQQTEKHASSNSRRLQRTAWPSGVIGIVSVANGANICNAA